MLFGAYFLFYLYYLFVYFCGKGYTFIFRIIWWIESSRGHNLLEFILQIFFYNQYISFDVIYSELVSQVCSLKKPFQVYIIIILFKKKKKVVWTFFYFIIIINNIFTW